MTLEERILWDSQIREVVNKVDAALDPDSERCQYPERMGS